MQLAASHTMNSETPQGEAVPRGGGMPQGANRLVATALAALAALALALALSMALVPTQAHAAGASWKRLAGADAYGTMAKISAQGWATSDVVVIACFDGYWDALSASSIAGRYNAPILLTGKSKLDSTAAAQIKRLKASRAIIVGGTAAVSNTVANQVRAALTGSKKIDRYWGDNACNTAVCVADELGDYRSDTCIIATSGGYWDALAASPYAYATGSPIYLTNDKGVIDELVLAAIEREKFTRAIIVGGNKAVAASTETILGRIGISQVKRLGGADACATSRLVAEWAIGQKALGANNMGVATINGYWDALCGAALCGKNKGALVLAYDGDISALKVASANKAAMKRGYVFGGTAAVSAKVFTACQKATTYQSAKI